MKMKKKKKETYYMPKRCRTMSLGCFVALLVPPSSTVIVEVGGGCQRTSFNLKSS